MIDRKKFIGTGPVETVIDTSKPKGMRLGLPGKLIEDPRVSCELGLLNVGGEMRIIIGINDPELGVKRLYPISRHDALMIREGLTQLLLKVPG